MFGNGLLTRHTLIYQCCKSIDQASSQVIHTLDYFPGKISTFSSDFAENLVKNRQILPRLHRFCFEIGEVWLKFVTLMVE